MLQREDKMDAVLDYVQTQQAIETVLFLWWLLILSEDQTGNRGNFFLLRIMFLSFFCRG